jgi:hypothetical protein
MNKLNKLFEILAKMSKGKRYWTTVAASTIVCVVLTQLFGPEILSGYIVGVLVMVVHYEWVKKGFGG